jgi:hypothetical protein
MTRSRFKPAKQKATTPAGHPWSAGDRAAGLSAVRLRQHRLNAFAYEKVDVDTFVQVVEILEEVIEATSEAESSEDFLVAEELPTAIREIEKARKSAEEDQNGRVKEIEEKYDDLEAQGNTERVEHAAEVRDHCKTIDELRKRAELAEHLLSIAPEELTRTTAAAVDGQLRANERAERCAEASRKMQAERDEFRTKNEQLERMLAAMRETKPLRARKVRA